MSIKLDEIVIQTIRSAAEKLRGANRRAFQAEVARDYCDGSPRTAERMFGWNRKTVEKGLSEQRTGGIIPAKNRSGRPCYSQQLPVLQEDIRSVVNPNSQAHSGFENTFRYTRMTAKAVLEALVRDKGYTKEELPTESTMRDLLHQMNYRLRRIQKTKVQKKFPKLMPFSQTSKPLKPEETPIRKH